MQSVPGTGQHWQGEVGMEEMRSDETEEGGGGIRRRKLKRMINVDE